MNFLFFIVWVVLISICSDLVGSALSIYFRLAGTGRGIGAGERNAPIDFVHSTLLGFATLWLILSAFYALGMATQQLILSFIGLSAVAAVVVQHRHVLSLVRSRLKFWGSIAAIAFLASFVTPTFKIDDPEYFFLINKLLRTGSVVEYFNYRRPLTLGGWTFIQAIFSSGPAGLTFVASIDAVIGSILFLFCAFLLGASTRIALQLALIAVLMVQPFQYNLGTAISMAAMCAVLITLSLPLSAPRNIFTPICFAVMAYTIRPQLGLIAIFATAVVLWRNRSKSLVTVGAVLVGISTLWLLIFIRDTGLLPLSKCPGTNPNPQFRELLCDDESRFALSYIKSVWQQHWTALSLTMLAFSMCVWKSTTSTTHSAAFRTDFQILGIFSVAVVATVFVLIAIIGPNAVVYSRYYIPIVEGYLYVFLITSAVHLFQSGVLLTYPSLPVVVTTIMLSLMVMLSAKKLSVPSESARKICSQVLTSEEQLQFERISRGNGYTLLQMECPVGSFENTSRTMMSDLFFSTHDEYVGITLDQEKTLNWLHKHGVAQILYLDNDPRWGLNDLRKLDEYCHGPRIYIHDHRGPLVVIDVITCIGQSDSNSDN